jgi:hypothetical protein
MKKIAFCFLIYDKIIHEELWNIFFDNIDTNKYSIYIHYKIDKPLKYFEKYKLTNCIETKYEDQTIPLAKNILFREAYKNTDNYKFQMISGSCIPLKSFNFIYDKLIADDYGYLNVSPQNQCFPNCNCLLGVIELKNIAKSHNWFIFNRKLVENLCFDKDEYLNKHYRTIHAPAEYFYYTFIKILELEGEIITTPNVANGATTFTNWQGVDYKYPSFNRLKNYSSVEEEELTYLLDSPSLYGRKFDERCTPSLFNKKYIDCISSK